MSRKRPEYIKKSFESVGASNDTSANIYMSMLVSPAFQDLTANQQRLYLFCKAQYYAEKRKPIEGNYQSFTMNKSKWCGLYKLYKAENYSGFQRDIEALISHGLIRCVECGEHTRTKSIYEFSDAWQKYGTPEFKLEPGDLTNAMRRKMKKKLMYMVKFY